MSHSEFCDSAEAFRSAVENHDLSLAQNALQNYIVCFQSRPRSHAEIESARNLLEWGVQAAKTHKMQMAEKLMLLRDLSNTYRPQRRVHTWRIEA